jgi:hypothetical protein
MKIDILWKGPQSSPGVVRCCIRYAGSPGRKTEALKGKWRRSSYSKCHETLFRVICSVKQTVRGTTSR